MSGIDYAAVKRAVPLRQVLDLIGWRPTEGSVSKGRGPCPLHGSGPQSRSFAVEADGWYCHKCKTGGDQLRLYFRVRGLQLYEATMELCGRLNVPVPLVPRQRRQRRPRPPRNREEER